MSTLLNQIETMRPADEAGPVLAGRGQAMHLREQVENLAGTERVVVDFGGVLAASPSWADEFFAKLDPELVRSRRVVFENLSAGLGAIARYVCDGRE